jgi:hypothetical protein
MSSINYCLKNLKVSVNNLPVSNVNPLIRLKSFERVMQAKDELLLALCRCQDSGYAASDEYRKAAKRAQSYLTKMSGLLSKV